MRGLGGVVICSGTLGKDARLSTHRRLRVIFHSGVSEQHRIVPSFPLLTPAVCSSIFGSGKDDQNPLIAVVSLDSL